MLGPGYSLRNDVLELEGNVRNFLSILSGLRIPRHRVHPFRFIVTDFG